ncbi:MAG: hypothetical protein MRK01_02950 [Candidatus Scalindua sp.]|nr:hypothetical protein [Candidatus Scalindua sp.]
MKSLMIVMLMIIAGVLIFDAKPVTAQTTPTAKARKPVTIKPKPWVNPETGVGNRMSPEARTLAAQRMRLPESQRRALNLLDLGIEPYDNNNGVDYEEGIWRFLKDFALLIK